MPAASRVSSVAGLLPPANRIDLVSASGQLATAIGRVTGVASVDGGSRVEV